MVAMTCWMSVRLSQYHQAASQLFAWRLTIRESIGGQAHLLVLFFCHRLISDKTIALPTPYETYSSLNRIDMKLAGRQIEGMAIVSDD